MLGIVIVTSSVEMYLGSTKFHHNNQNEACNYLSFTRLYSASKKNFAVAVAVLVVVAVLVLYSWKVWCRKKVFS